MGNDNTEPLYRVYREGEKIVLGRVFTVAAYGALADAYQASPRFDRLWEKSFRIRLAGRMQRPRKSSLP